MLRLSRSGSSCMVVVRLIFGLSVLFSSKSKHSLMKLDLRPKSCTLYSPYHSIRLSLPQEARAALQPHSSSLLSYSCSSLPRFRSGNASYKPISASQFISAAPALAIGHSSASKLYSLPTAIVTLCLNSPPWKGSVSGTHVLGTVHVLPGAFLPSWPLAPACLGLMLALPPAGCLTLPLCAYFLISKMGIIVLHIFVVKI